MSSKAPNISALLFCGPHSETGLPLGDEMAAAALDLPSRTRAAATTPIERDSLSSGIFLRSLRCSLSRGLQQTYLPISLNTEHTCPFLTHFLCHMLINGLGKEGSLLPISLIQSRTIPGCGGRVTFRFKRGGAGTQLRTIEGSPVLKGMGWASACT